MTLVDTLQLVVLLAFAVINGTQLGGLVLAARALLMRDRRVSRLEETALTRASTYLPVSFLVAAYNEEATIVGSVRSLLGMHYPEYELIIVNDGSKDGTMRVLHEAFELVPTLASPRRITPHATVRGTWRSATHPSLTVIDKENGGRSDALNTALEQARYPIAVVIDADSLVDPEALLLAGKRFLDDPTLVALGGAIRPVNEAVVNGGSVRLARTPRNFLARMQQLEYARAFTAARVAMSQLGCLVLISGAFGLFRRSALIAIGGWRTDTVGEDFELTVRLHRYFRDRGEPYRIEYLVDPVCWMLLPHAPHRAEDRLRLLNAVVTESLWYRPWLAVVRLVATFGIRSKRGKWGTMTRRSFG